nr:ORF3 [Epsilontorquevirus sp.]
MTREEYKSRIQKRRNRGHSYTTGTSDGATSPTALLNALCKLTSQTQIRSTARKRRGGERKSPSPRKKRYSPKTSICTYRVHPDTRRRTGNLPKTPSSTGSETDRTRTRRRNSRRSSTTSGNRRRKTSTTSESISENSGTTWTSTDYSSGDSAPEMGTELGRHLPGKGLHKDTRKESQVYW